MNSTRSSAPQDTCCSEAGNLRAAKWLAFLFLAFFTVQAIYLHDIGNDLALYADGFSEANVLRGVEAFQKDGITSHYGLPRSLYGKRFPQNGMVGDHLDEHGLVPEPFRRGFPENLASRDEWPYTHYPPGPEWLCATMAKAIGIDPIWRLRLLPLTVSLVAFAFFFWTLHRVFSPKRALIIAVACALLPRLTLCLPSLHYLGYSMALVLVEISLLLRLFWGATSLRAIHFIACGLLGFAQGWLSFDQCFVVTLLPLALWCLRRAEGTAPAFPIPFALAFVLGSGFVIAHLLHFLQVAGELGGLQAAMRELGSTAAERGGLSGVEGKGYAQFLASAVYFYTRETLKPTGTHFGPMLLIFLMLGAVSLALAARRVPAAGRFASSFTLGGSGWVGAFPALAVAFGVSTVWMLAMPQHAVGNYHITVSHIIVFYFAVVVTLTRLQIFQPESQSP